MSLSWFLGLCFAGRGGISQFVCLVWAFCFTLVESVHEVVGFGGIFPKR